MMVRGWYSWLVRVAFGRAPSDWEIIGHLTDGYGPLWFCEKPEYDLSLELVSVERTADRLTSYIEHTVVQIEGVEALLSDKPFNGSLWKYRLDLKFSATSRRWVFDSADLIDDMPVRIEASDDLDSVFELVASDIDWDDYLIYTDTTSAELMRQLPKTFQKYYEPIHNAFIKRHEFV